MIKTVTALAIALGTLAGTAAYADENGGFERRAQLQQLWGNASSDEGSAQVSVTRQETGGTFVGSKTDGFTASKAREYDSRGPLTDVELRFLRTQPDRAGN